MNSASSKKHRLKSKSVLAKWAVSYILILLIPNLVFIYGYRVTVTTMQSEIRKANELVLNNLQGNIDKLLVNAREAYAYAYSTKPLSIIKQYAYKNPLFYYEASQLVQSLSAYANNNNNELKFLIYFRDLNYIVTNGTANTSMALYGSQVNSGMKLSYDDWQSLLQKEYENFYMLSSDLQAGNTEPCIVYANTVNRPSVNINFFVSVPLSTIKAYTDGLTDRTLLISGSQGEAITYFGNELPPLEDIKELHFTVPLGGKITDTNGNHYINANRESTQTNWYYSLITPETSFFETSKSLSVLFVGCFAVSLILGVFLVGVLLRQNYKPVGSILSIIDHGDTSGDEFELIKNSYKQLAFENHSMQSTLTKQAEQLRERYLPSRLKGRKSYLDTRDANTYFHMDIQEEVFTLIAFSVGSLTYEASADYQDELEYYNINLFAVDNVFSEIMNGYSYYKVEDGQLLLYLLHLNQEQQELWRNNGLAQIAEICELFIERLSVPLTAAVSEAMKHFNHISILYSDVLDALEYKNIIGGSGIIQTADLKGTDLFLDKRTKRTQCLAAAVGEGNYEKARSVIKEVFEDNKINTALPFAVFRILIMNDLNTVLNAFYEAVLDTAPHNKLLVSKLEPLTASSEACTLYHNFCDFLTFVCGIIARQNDGTENRLVEQIEKYVNSHYQDCNLNISTIAQEINRNPRHISRIFKMQTNEGLLDYINRIRIKKAKEIMEEEDITMEELAEKVGYTNDRTFRRAFSRAEGTTPGRYIQNCSE